VQIPVAGPVLGFDGDDSFLDGVDHLDKGVERMLAGDRCRWDGTFRFPSGTAVPHHALHPSSATVLYHMPHAKKRCRLPFRCCCDTMLLFGKPTGGVALETSALHTDFYQLTMMQGYFKEGKARQRVVF